MAKSINKVVALTATAALASSALVPTAAAAAENAENLKLAEVIYVKDGKNLTLSISDYQQAVAVGALKSGGMNYIKASNGEYYSLSDYQQALAVNKGDMAAALEVLAKAELAQDLKNVESGEIKDGTVVGQGEDNGQVTEISVESVKAINANLVQVTLSDDAPALKAENVKISNGVTVNKVTVAGKTVTVETSTLPANKDLTVTFAGVADLDKASGTFKFNQAVNLETAIEGFVYVPKLKEDGTQDGNKVVPAIDVTVTAADGTTTKTDANGYYKLPAQVGTVEVTVKADGHYVSEEDIVVAAKNSTAHVVQLEQVDVDKLQIEGTVKDSKTGAVLTNATTELQEKVDGKWQAIAEVTTADGNYAFLNSKADTTVAGKEEFKDIFGERTNKIKHGTEYRVVVKKGEDTVVAKEEERPYHTATLNFKLSDKSSRTFEPVAMEAVKEIKKIDIDFHYGAVFADAIAAADVTPTFTLIAPDGEKTLVLEEDVEDLLTLKKDANTATHAGALNLVDALTDSDENEKMYLKSGTYYLKVDDGLAAEGEDYAGTAIQAIPLKITEGVDATAKFEAKKAENATVTSQFNTVNPAVEKTTEVNADVKVFKTIDGVDVLLEEAKTGSTESAIIDGGTDATGQLKYAFDTDGKKLTGELALSRLAAEGYKVVVDHDYILGNPSTNVKLESGKTVQSNLAVEAGGALVVKTQFVDKDKAKLNELGGNIVYTTVELTDKAGTKTEKTIPLVFKTKEEPNQLNEELTAAALKGTGITVEQTNETGELTFTFGKLKESDYTATFTGEEFKTNNSKATEVIMLQNNPETSKVETVDLEMTPNIELKGSITFGATKENAQAGLIKVFDMNGDTPTPVKSTDVTTVIDEAGQYEVTLKKAPKGKYKVVFYGQNPAGKPGEKVSQFETVEKVFDLTKGENFEHISVVKGGQGKLEFNVFDSNGNRLNSATDNFTFTVVDAYDTELKVWGSSSSAEAFVVANGYTESDVDLSKGDYKVKITSADKNKYQAVSQTVTVDRINGTTLTTIEVPLVNNGKTFEVSGKITGLPTNAHGTTNVALAAKDVKVIVFNASTGEYVHEATVTDVASNAAKFNTQLSNGGYIVKTYVNGHFVAQKEVEVKDRKVDNADMTTKEAKR